MRTQHGTFSGPSCQVKFTGWTWVLGKPPHWFSYPCPSWMVRPANRLHGIYWLLSIRVSPNGQWEILRDWWWCIASELCVIWWDSHILIVVKTLPSNNEVGASWNSPVSQSFSTTMPFLVYRRKGCAPADTSYVGDELSVFKPMTRKTLIYAILDMYRKSSEQLSDYGS